MSNKNEYPLFKSKLDKKTKKQAKIARGDGLDFAQQEELYCKDNPKDCAIDLANRRCEGKYPNNPKLQTYCKCGIHSELGGEPKEKLNKICDQAYKQLYNDEKKE